MPYGGSSVDEQVVKMSFDNSNFDSNVNDSIKVLNNLDQRLSIFDNKEHLNNINTSFSNLANTFSIKGQIMFGVLTNLGKEIYSLGKRAFGALTKGIRDGVGEYHTIIESTEAIYQNVKQNGNSLQDVNNALDELNDYADKTIYNFGQMTRMIGMFSSAGVGLKSSVSTIKGLANSAALVGANMQKAQMAWNAVSRAMSSGRFTNVTWRSLELSGIAGKQFNKVITEVARTMKVKGKQTGKDIDGMIKKWGSLRESLREGWLKKDVFTEAMDIMSGALDRDALKQRKYTDKQIDELLKIAEAAEEAATRVKTFKQLMDTIGEAIGSGWAQSFRILLGDLEDAKKLYTRISNVISDFIDNNANIRNELFKQIISGKDKGVDGKWKSGQDNFRQIIENMLAIVKTFLKSVKTGFYNIFPIERISAACRKVLGVIEQFTRAFVLNTGKIQKDGQELWDTTNVDKMSEAIKDLIRFFRGLASAVDIAWMAISQPIKVIFKRIPFFNNFFEKTGNFVKSLTKRLGDFGDKITGFRDAAKDWEIFGYVTEYVLDNIDELAKKNPVLGAFVWVIRSIQNAIKGVKNGIKDLGIKPLSALFGIFKMVVTATWRALNNLFGLLQSATSKVDWSWLERPKKVITSILKVFSDYGRGLISFEQAVQKLKQTFANIFGIKLDGADKIATATHKIQEQYANLNVTVEKTGKKIQSVWEKIKGFFKPVSDYFNNLKNNGELTFDGIAKKIALIGGGVTAATLSISHLVKSFKKINIMNNISDLLGAGIDVLKAYQKEAQSKVILNIAIAVGILAAAMAALSFIDYNKLENGLTIFTAFMTVVAMTTSIAVGAITKFTNSIAKMRENLNPVNNMISSIRKVAKRFANGFIIRMIGKSLIDLAIAVAIVTASLIALKLVFKDPKEIEEPLNNIKEIVKTLTIAIGALVVVMEIFSALGSKLSGTVGALSGFLKLAGVSGVILSIATAVAILVGSLYVVSNIDATRLKDSWEIIKELVIIIGAISVIITAIVSSINLGDTGKLKKITIKLTGVVAAMAAVIAGIAVLVHIISKDNTNSWWPALLSITGVMSAFSVMMISIMTFAKQLGGKDRVWSNLNKTIGTLTVCMLSLVAGLYALSYAKSIPASIVTTIGIVTAATSALLIFIAYFTSKSKGSGFATDFVKVIQGLSIAVSALTASLGIMAAGLAAFIMAINSLSISSNDAKKASNSIIEKLVYAGEVIEKSIPGLKTFFTKLGKTAAVIFTSFISSFFNTVSEIGDKYNSIIEKVVNLVIDILKKAATTLHSRKDDIAKIIKDVVDLIGTEAAAAINAFFGKDGKPVVSSNTVLNWLGIGGIAVGTGKVVLEGIKNYNAIASAIDHTGDSIEHGKKTVNKLAKAFKELKLQIWYQKTLAKEYGEGIFSSFVKTSDSVKGFNSNAANAAASCGAIAVAVAAITTAVIALNGAWKRWTGEVKDSYKMEDLFSFKGFEQVVVDGFEKLGRIMIQFGLTLARGILGIFSGLAYLITSAITQPIMHIADGLYQTFGWKWAKGLTDNLGGVLKGLEETSTKSFGSIATGWKNVWNENGENANIGLDFFDKSLNTHLEESKIEAYKKSKEITENYKQGAVDGLAGMEDALVDVQSKANAGLIAGAKVDLDEHSPSKKSYSIYWNYILGAENALSNGGKELVSVMESNNKKLIKTTITGSKTIEEAYGKIGAKLDTRKGLNTYDIKYQEYGGEGKEKEVTFHKELTEAILAEKDALLGLSEAEAEKFVQEKAVRMDVEDWAGESAKILDYLFGIQREKDKILWSSIQSLEEATTRSWSEVLSTEEEASKIALEKQLDTNKALIDIAEDKKKQLVGKNKKQVQEILENELKARGMTEEQAEEESKKMVAFMFARQKQQKKLEASSLDASVSIMKAQVDAYKVSQSEITAALEKELDKRTKMEANAAKWQKMAEEGKLTTPELQRAYIQSKAQLDQQNGKVNTLKAQLDSIVKNTTAALQKTGTLNSKQFETDYASAVKQLNINGKKSNKSISETLKNFWNDVKGRLPGVPDLKTWNYNTGKNNNNLKDDKNKAIKDSKDLKKDLEKNRADLTPTFDLDKLASDANKANGIVMSSLMAAQNASIGDYINKDSELNPFMKDRWQNVYNFTQNNYSPKALSRIDIYRQTQRQLSMSRGF